MDTPLNDALASASRRWEGHRWHTGAMSQGRQVIKTFAAFEVTTLGQVTDATVRRAVEQWKGAGIAAATINLRLSVLSVMGITAPKTRQAVSRRLKWWLRPDLYPVVMADLAQAGDTASAYLAKYIDWALVTGLRVEETLRLHRRHFADDFRLVMVPGTKTSGSERTLPLGPKASDAARACFPNDGDCPDDTRMLPLPYKALMFAWVDCRERLGIDHPTATLKAFRRNAARYLHVDCGMPIDMVRQYLRHEKLETTLGYLRLTGGYGEDEMRRYLR